MATSIAACASSRLPNSASPPESAVSFVLFRLNRSGKQNKLAVRACLQYLNPLQAANYLLSRRCGMDRHETATMSDGESSEDVSPTPALPFPPSPIS
jgi:hypothetical protein